MARKKLRPQRLRREPASERSFFEWAEKSERKSLDRLDLLNLIRGGEDTFIELKVRLTNVEKVAAEIVALANTGGGAVIFGVNDNCKVEGLDDPEQVEDELLRICRTHIIPPIFPYIDKVAFDNGRRIIVLEIDERRAPHYTIDGRYYVREGSNKREATGDEVAFLFAKLRPTGFESAPIYEARVEDLDESFIWSYIRELQGELFKRGSNYPTAEVVRDMRLGIDYSDGITPTVSGLLLFGQDKRVEDIFSRSRIQAVRISGRTLNDPKIETAEYAGNLATIFERMLSFIKRYADLWETTAPRSHRMRSQEPINPRANYHMGAVVESITNALVHRDYCIREHPCKLLVFDDRIEIINPCHTNGLPKKGIELYGLAHPPNPRIKSVFKSAAYGLKTVCGGIPMIRLAGYRFSEREPKITIHQDEFKVELYGI